MDQSPMQGFDGLIDEILSVCYSHSVFILNADNFRVTEFDAVRTPDGKSVLFTGYQLETPTTITEDTPARKRLLRWVVENPYVIVIVYSKTKEIDPKTKLNKKEVRGYLIKYDQDSHKVTFERMPKDDLIRCRSLNPKTGQPVKPSSDEIFL